MSHFIYKNNIKNSYVKLRNLGVETAEQREAALRHAGRAISQCDFRTLAEGCFIDVSQNGAIPQSDSPTIQYRTDVSQRCLVPGGAHGWGSQALRHRTSTCTIGSYYE